MTPQFVIEVWERSYNGELNLAASFGYDTKEKAFKALEVLSQDSATYRLVLHWIL